MTPCAIGRFLSPLPSTLLFAFLIEDESAMHITIEGWEKSDKLQDLLKELKPDLTHMNDELNNLLHPDKFLIRDINPQ